MKISVWKGIKKFKKIISIITEEKERNLIAIDETIVKGGGKGYYVYSAVELKNELILMGVYTTRNYLTRDPFKRSIKILQE